MNVTLKESFEKRRSGSKFDICTLEKYEDGSIYIFGEELGELIVEFADDAYEKAVSQLEDLGYEKSVAISDGAKQQAG
jgi:hypothetical protein